MVVTRSMLALKLEAFNAFVNNHPSHALGLRRDERGYYLIDSFGVFSIPPTRMTSREMFYYIQGLEDGISNFATIGT